MPDTFLSEEGGFSFSEYNKLQENSRILFGAPGFERLFGGMVQNREES
jgi:hypothetical protein